MVAGEWDPGGEAGSDVGGRAGCVVLGTSCRLRRAGDRPWGGWLERIRPRGVPQVLEFLEWKPRVPF